VPRVTNLEETKMITLHRLGHNDEPFDLNDDLIVTVEACPDTVISLATGAKIVVNESPDAVADAVRKWRASIRLAALRVA
jgi:flagellar protein FlbD